MSLSRRQFLVAGAASVAAAAGVAAACSPAASTAPAGAPTAAPVPTQPPTVAPTPVPTLTQSVAPTQAPTAVSTLKIGILVPYTESSVGADIGLDQKRAADLYLKQHNGQLGGRAVNLVYSAESVETAINRVKIKTLTDTENVSILLGGASDDTAKALAEAAQAARLIYVDTNATANELTRAKTPNVFRTSASAWQFSEPLGEWVSRRSDSEFFVSYVDDSFGSASADAFVAGLGKSGGSATQRVAFANGGDWVKAIGTIKGQSTKNVYAAFHTDDAEGFLGEWQKQGMAEAGYRLFGPGLLTDTQVLLASEAAAEGAITSHFWSSELGTPENQSLMDAFTKEHFDTDTGQPVPLSGYAVAMWDTMTALDAALEQSGGNASDIQAFSAALAGVSFKSPRGMFAFDKATRNPVQDILIRQVKASNGKLVNAILDKVLAVADPGA